MFHEIWRLDSARISSAVLPRSIECYNTTVEIQEAEERQQEIDPYRRYDPLKAQSRLLQGCLANSFVSSNIAEYAATLASNERLVRITQKANMLSKICRFSCLNSIGRECIIHVFYRIWHLTIKHSRNFAKFKVDSMAAFAHGDDRHDYLRALDVTKRDDMVRVVRFLVYDCPGKELVKLGISKPLKNPATTPICLVRIQWAFEFSRVATLSQDWRTSNYVGLRNKFVMYKDC